MSYDVLVIGGGHAGAEAAVLAARAGAHVLLLTQNLETIGQMSCNPAIGGIAKGTVVKEVDALGGIMGRATDRARIQFRMLNRSKGPAVWSPRAQCDRGLYRRAVKAELERFPGISLKQGTVAGISLAGDRVVGVATTDGFNIPCRAVVLTAGTFLRGKIHQGLSKPISAGRAGEAPALEISSQLADLGLDISRFKTGTPPRIDGRTVDFEGLSRQDGDEVDYRFSTIGTQYELQRQLPCWLTWTGVGLKEIISAHLQESALYGGEISGRGPRYCPSIEDKIVRFPNAIRHQVFLEPEGLDTSEMYVNGLSTSLPPDIQLRYLRTVPGLEGVEMTRPGYAIEYDYFPPTQLNRGLAYKALRGLYLAGQVNGTTGYEEAAGQGALAGLNAALYALDREPVELGRNVAMIGVMVDDLVSRGVDEPYRLFTSRAEFRLSLRQDNAIRRLAPLALRLGLYNEVERRIVEDLLSGDQVALNLAKGTTISPSEANPYLFEVDAGEINEPIRISEVIRRPGTSLSQLLRLCGVYPNASEQSVSWAEIEMKYVGYLEREREMAARLTRMEELLIPEDLPYMDLQVLAWEAREKLSKIQPSTLGQAGRVPGVTPSDLHGLALAIMRHKSRNTTTSN